MLRKTMIALAVSGGLLGGLTADDPATEKRPAAKTVERAKPSSSAADLAELFAYFDTWGSDYVTYLRRHRADRLPSWQSLADQGDPAAALLVGLCHRYGIGGEQDLTAALARYRGAADAGLTEGMVFYGVALASGAGIAANPEAGAEWVRRATKQRSALALHTFAQFHLRGFGVPRNVQKGLDLLSQSADAGSKHALCCLGELYLGLVGDVVPIDPPKGIRLLQEAADKGSAAAMNTLGGVYEDGNRVPKDLVEAVRWYQKSAATGYPPALTNLGNCFGEGRGVKKSLADALDCYRKAAEEGDPAGMYNLALVYYRGEGVKADPVESFRWVKRAAEAGHSDAMTNLGSYYQNGTGTAMNYKLAVKWHTRAAEKGCPVATRNLARCYEHGLGIPPNRSKAAELYGKAEQLMRNN